MKVPTPKKILLLSGLDPSGGAGLQADIQVCGLLGCHSLPIMTCNTIQNSQRCYDVKGESPLWIKQQLDSLLADITPDAIKIGAIGSAAIVDVIVSTINATDLPAIYDPVLKAGGRGRLGDSELLDKVVSKLLPVCSLITPNIEELKMLSGLEEELPAIENLYGKGVTKALVTGGHDIAAENVGTNRLYNKGTLEAQRPWTKYPGEHHGTGCTLATATTCFLAHGHSVADSCKHALNFMDHAVKHAYIIGNGQKIPKRLSDKQDH